MGFSVSWCAVPEEAAQKCFEKLGLSPTGATEEIPESLISSATLDTGWRVLCTTSMDALFSGRAIWPTCPKSTMCCYVSSRNM